jgi:hypothetical protein
MYLNPKKNIKIIKKKINHNNFDIFYIFYFLDFFIINLYYSIY